MNAYARRIAFRALACLSLACPVIAQAQTTVKYVHTDALGSVVAMTSASGSIVETTREYEPYGQQLTPAIQDGAGYTGHVQDEATGLTYMQQRYYDPTIGRFLSVDPVTANASTGANFNRYWYANNNPYKFTDPDGRIGKLIIEVVKRLLPKILPKAAPKAAPKTAPRQSPQNKPPQQPRNEPAPPDSQPSNRERPLPRDRDGNPRPDPEANGPHTQLGQKEGRNGKYDQAREFDGDGKPVRDIDFTDHGRGNHPNPHQHRYVPNPTGGTPQRGPTEPLGGG